ncbi:MAG: FkbM family methyltransferase, partial [Bacteroidales bacterium]|nr:FkbM family methyltransferase [Bacteroidales bacterium]
MNKIYTFLKYFKDFIKWREYRYILTSMKFVLLRKTTSKSRIYKSSLGTFLVRKGTIDFQFANYAYEWNVKEFVYKHLDSYNVFLDIGANMGTYSILLAEKGLRGYAFEPIKSNYNATRINLILNNLDDKVKVFNLALGDHKKKAEFAFDVLNTGASHMVGVELVENLDDKQMIIESTIVPLDDLMTEMQISSDDKIFIKIDVEGMEEKVLLGARKFLQTY